MTPRPLPHRIIAETARHRGDVTVYAIACQCGYVAETGDRERTRALFRRHVAAAGAPERVAS